METIATIKGQIIIPSKLRKKYGIKGGTRIQIIDEGEAIVLKPITGAYISKLRGSLKKGGALKILEEERRKERNR